MADNDYKELIDFLGKHFEGIDKKFEGVYGELKNTKEGLRAEIAAAKEETMRHTGVLIEDVKHKLDLVVEGVTGVNEKLDRHISENEKEHARLEKMSLISAADISSLDQRVGRLEGKA